jgi:SAM-dependent methyltransferase
MKARLPCPICDGTCGFLGDVDFNKSCEERRGKFLPPAGVSVAYFLCDRCGFCFAPEFARWRPEDFASRIYNKDYPQVDPDYFEVRPRVNAEMLVSMCGERVRGIRHLDYGGGLGLLSELLREAGWQSTSYDRRENDVRAELAGGFDLVTAFEVFEHAADVRQLVADIASLLAPDGIVLFSTLVSDGHLAPGQRMDWWYASPRNGHVSLFTRDSLVTLGASEGFTCGSFSEDLHAYWKKVPPWASHMILDR